MRFSLFIFNNSTGLLQKVSSWSCNCWPPSSQKIIPCDLWGIVKYTVIHNALPEKSQEILSGDMGAIDYISINEFL